MWTDHQGLGEEGGKAEGEREKEEPSAFLTTQPSCPMEEQRSHLGYSNVS